MPAIVGAVNVNSVSGVFNIGDVRTISPKTFSKTFAGGGSFNSGDKLDINNHQSIIKVYDPDAVSDSQWLQQ
jgi:spore germination protein PA